MDKPRANRRNPFNLNTVRKLAFNYYQHNLGRQLENSLYGAGTSFNLTTFKRPISKRSNQDQPQTSQEAFRKQKSLKLYKNNLHTFSYTDEDINGYKINKMSNNKQLLEAKQPLTTASSSKPKTQPKYDVHRDVLTHELVIKQTGYHAADKSIPYAMKQCWHNWSFLAIFAGIIPILEWLPKYSIKRDLVGDIMAGTTVAIMHIPHGMAYGILAGLSPGNGLYMAIFPTLVYMILGTSKHISIGTFAVASMMTLKVVQTYATESKMAKVITEPTMNTEVLVTNIDSTSAITPLEVATTLAFTVGLLHLAMGFFRLGTLSSLLSEPLVNGFTTGAACHVVTSQLKDVFDVSVKRHKGTFKILKTVIDISKSISTANLATLTFCLCVMIFMTICNELIKPCVRKCCRFPLPVELIAVVGGTVISMLVNVKETYGIKLVGAVPTGLPMPVLPRFELVPSLVVDSIAICIVTYSIVMSLALNFAKKHSYEIKPNQELFAMGIGNVVGGFFHCIPMAASLSRSLIQEQTGGASQIASLVSAILIIITLYWTGPFFAFLPRCVLAGVIIVALKPMFMQAKQLKNFAKQGKLEVLTWLCTFISVVLIDIDIGLLIGVCVSLLTLYIKGFKPYSCLLGYIPEASAVYVDISHHRNVFEVPETKIFRYTGSCNFATSMYFRKTLYNALGLDNAKMPRAAYTPIRQNGTITAANGGSALSNLTSSFRFLVLDLSALSHIDVAGSHLLSDVQKELEKRGVRIFIASPSDKVYDTLVHSMALGDGPFEIFPTLHDAVEYSNACRTA